MKKLLYLLVLLFFQGCTVYDYKTLSSDEFIQSPGKGIISIITNSGNRFSFAENQGKFVEFENAVAGYTNDSGYVFIPVDQIFRVRDSLRIFDLKNYSLNDTTRYFGVSTKDGRLYTFNKIAGGAKFYKDHQMKVAGVDTLNKYRELNLSEISYLHFKSYNSLRSFGGTLCIGAVAGGVILAIAMAAKGSCPFIYSFDGERYEFDKEPLGGATMPILQRTDYSKLTHLEASGSEYKLMLTNEVDETQYVDNLELIYTDHSPSEKIYPDIKNNLYSISNEELRFQ